MNWWNGIFLGFTRSYIESCNATYYSRNLLRYPVYVFFTVVPYKIMQPFCLPLLLGLSCSRDIGQMIYQWHRVQFFGATYVIQQVRAISVRWSMWQPKIMICQRNDIYDLAKRMTWLSLPFCFLIVFIARTQAKPPFSDNPMTNCALIGKG